MMPHSPSQAQTGIVQESTIWTGKPFNWGLPSFTRYTITDRRLIVEKGIFVKKREEVRLFRVTDVSTKRNLIERILRFGDIYVKSSDRTMPDGVLRNIRKCNQVADSLSFAAERARHLHRGVLELDAIQPEFNPM